MCIRDRHNTYLRDVGGGLKLGNKLFVGSRGECNALGGNYWGKKTVCLKIYVKRFLSTRIVKNIGFAVIIVVH